MSTQAKNKGGFTCGNEFENVSVFMDALSHACTTFLNKWIYALLFNAYVKGAVVASYGLVIVSAVYMCRCV